MDPLKPRNKNLSPPIIKSHLKPKKTIPVIDSLALKPPKTNHSPPIITSPLKPKKTKPNLSSPVAYNSAVLCTGGVDGFQGARVEKGIAVSYAKVDKGKGIAVSSDAPPISYVMENKRSNLTPIKRPKNEADGNLSSKEPTPSKVTRYRNVKILLPNGMTVLLKLSETIERIHVKDLVKKVKEQYDRDVESEKSSPRRRVNWEGEGVFFVDDRDTELRNMLNFTKLRLDRVCNLRLDDGSKPADIFENMWNLTLDPELLMVLPEEYTFETALADLIDNSLQAVWSNYHKDRRLIRVEVSDEKISIVDTGPGMDNSSIEKWGEMGESLHRVHKTQAVGGKPPYLKPSFGMFGYGGFIASMHLGRHTEVSSKTKNSIKVYMLRLQRDALVRGSGSKQTWRTSGSVRDPSGDELELSPGGSFTKVDIYEPKMKNIDINWLKCKLKDIYFPYIQCDDSSKGETITPIEFQVNGDDLAEILGGEVVTTNMHSCNGPEFVLQLRFELNRDIATATSSPGSGSSQEANARLRCVYLPAKEGKETIETILETLKGDGLGYKEEVGSFSHVSCRRLGRLLPDARWDWIPFMDFRQRKGEKSQILKRICNRVKCFIETDAGFNPTLSKTDFAHRNPYTNALRNLGSKQPLGKEIGVCVDIRRDGKLLTLNQLDKLYRQWLLDMHDQYDEESEADCGTDDPVHDQYKAVVATKHEEAIRFLEDQIRTIESSLSKLDVARDRTLCKYGSPGKDEIITRVESMTDSAAGLVTNLFREGPEQDHHGLLGNIIGVVALLGTAPFLGLSRMFAEYLGDQMLAVVCKSYRDVGLFDTYEKSGKLKREQVLEIFPTELRESVNGRYHVLCLENISPCKVKKDRKGKILLPDPTLPNGSPPNGFIDYAVNLIDIDVDHVDTKIGRGYGLRETLFYRLFGETQVYISKEHMESASHYIKDGAISLDGMIIRGNGATSVGCLKRDIIFPVIHPTNLSEYQQAMQKNKRDSELLKRKLKKTKEALNEEKKLHKLRRKGLQNDKISIKSTALRTVP